MAYLVSERADENGKASHILQKGSHNILKAWWRIYVKTSTAVELFDSNVHFLTFECVYAVEQNKVEKNVSALWLAQSHVPLCILSLRDV